MTAFEYWKEYHGLPENETERVAVGMMQLYATQQTKELSEEISAMKRSIVLGDDSKVRLIEENERLKEALSKIDNLIGNYMHNDSYKIGTLVLDIQEIAVKN